MKSKVRSAKIMAAGAASLALVLAACSPGSDSSSNTDPDSTAGDKTPVTFRLWDDVAAPAYEDSFTEFEKQNEDITVKVEVVPWGQYWERLPLDINSGDMADIFWVNSSNFAPVSSAISRSTSHFMRIWSMTAKVSQPTKSSGG